MLKKLIENAAENNDVKRVIADGAYDNNENFRYLSDNNGIEAAAIKVRKEEFVCRQDNPFSSKKYYCTTTAEKF